MADQRLLIARRGAAVWLWPGAIWLAVTATTLAARPPMTADLPTQAAAWWVWLGREDVAYLSADGASWPPLLFWIIEIGWRLFGVSEIWPRFAAAAGGLISVAMVAAVARRLWPEDPDAPHFCAIVLAGSGGFVAYLTATSNVWLLMLLTTLALFGLVLAWQRRPPVGWIVFAAAVFLGELGSGAAALWHMLPLALLAPLALADIRGTSLLRWCGAAVTAVLLGLVAAAAVAPAASAHETLARLLLRPTPLVEANQPWFWYLLVLPLFLFPWLWWTSLWWAAARARRQFKSAALRLCLLAASVALIVAISTGRQTIELLPILPPLSLAVARIWAAHARKAKDFHAALPGLLALFVCLFFFMLNIIPVAHLDAVWRRLFDRDLPIWLGGISLASGLALLSGSYLLALLTPRSSLTRLVQLALLPMLLALTVNLEFALSLRPFFDLAPIAERVRTLAESGRPIAVFARYHGELDFSARLRQPPLVLRDVPEALVWAAAHRDGVVLSLFRGSILHLPAQPLYLGHAEDFRAALWASAAVTATDGAVLRPRL
jgi:4-amino-4-deoxy-L-arabinose transferase-like glycosyltransferase